MLESGHPRNAWRHHPLVSVIVPTHKSDPPFLSQTLRSVLDQDFADWELIVVDDGSPDPQSLRERCLIDSRISVISTEPGGVARARNRGLAVARGALVAFLDYDDSWYDSHLSTLVAAIDGKSGVVGVYSGFDVVDSVSTVKLRTSNASVQPSRRSVLSGGTRPSLVTLLLHRQEVEAVGGFLPAVEGADDVDLIIRLLDRGRFLAIDAVTACYRWHGGNTSRDARRMGEAADRSLTANMSRLARLNQTADVQYLRIARKAVHRYYAAAAARQAVDHVARPSLMDAWRLLMWACKFSPRGVLEVLLVGGVRRAARLATPYCSSLARRVGCQVIEQRGR